MPIPIAAIGTQAAGQATGMGMGLLGNAIGAKSRLRQANKLYALEAYYNKEMIDYQKQSDLGMWEATGPQGQMLQLKKAGLNPGLIYGMGGAGGQTTGGSAGVGSPQGAEMSGNIIQGMQLGMQYQLLKAQKENIEADTANKQADTVNKPKQGANIDADTVNKTLESIILKYGGDEAKRQWNINKELSLEEYGAKADEFEARKAVAAQIVKLHEDGTMQKMTDAELENKLKDIGLKNLQIDGKKLENAILELEKDMQTTLGLDRSAPTWAKMIGRLIMSFIK